MRGKYITLLFSSILAAYVIVGCGKKDVQVEEADTVVEPDLVVKNDSMIYGLTCDGTTDSVIVLWPFKGEPVELSCIEAKHNGRIIGKPEIGDWTGVKLDKEDSTVANIIVDLDQLKGTWTYPVMPVMKDLQHMSKRMQRRMMANLPDSVKQTFLVPREYGFTLKRNHKAQAVGVIMRSSTLEDDSPVLYPEVKRYSQWYSWNGKLLLVSFERSPYEVEMDVAPKMKVDTMDFVMMTVDSLVLKQNGRKYRFHRKLNAMKANEAAMKAVEKLEEKNKLN